MARWFLHLCPLAPARTGNGLAMRIGILADALAQIGESVVVSIGPDAPPARPWPSAARHLHIGTVGREHTPLRLISQIPDAATRLAAFRKLGRPMASLPYSGAVAKEIAAAAGPGVPDLVFISRARLLPLLDAFPGPWRAVPVIVDFDDDDAEYCRQQAALVRSTGDAARGDALEAEAEAYDLLVRANTPKISLGLAASPVVAASLRRSLEIPRIEVLRNGIDVPNPPQSPTSAGRRETLIFVGNLSYDANIDGLLWFLDEVWPRLRADRPEAQLLVAGSRPADVVRQACQAPGVTLHADAEDLGPLYAVADAAVVPLRVGSGSRIKILEAAVYNVPVISTSQGAEGLDADVVSEIDLADDGPTFAAACANHLRESGDASALRRRVVARHARPAIIAEAARLIRETIVAAPTAWDNG